MHGGAFSGTDPSRCTLAQRGPFRIDQCSCGTIHLTIGAVTVRLMPLAYAELAVTMLQGVEQLQPPAANQHAH